MRVTVVGLGKLGLPLAAFYLSRGHQVTGADIDHERLARIRAFDAELADEPELVDALRAGQAAGRWRTSESTADAVADADVVVMIVPVHATSEHEIELAALDAAAEDVSRGLGVGALVLVESTVPVGTTRTRVLPRLARGRTHGRDFHLAYSPERVSVGTVFRDLRRYPKIVGGIDAAATDHAAAFYREGLGLETWTVGETETAEFVKLIETAYRDANIALANSFARAADELGIDVTVAIRAANSQPYANIHAPGVGVGGNCIPVYPYLYAAGAPAGTELSLAARRINDEMAAYAVERLRSALDPLGGLRVLILGVTYRPGVPETANSSALLLRDALRAQGAVVLAADPLLPSTRLERLGFVPAQAPAYAPADAVILQSAASAFADLAWVKATGCRVVLDGRNALDREAIERLGPRYLGIGR